MSQGTPVYGPIPIDEGRYRTKEGVSVKNVRGKWLHRLAIVYL
jgi:hypothetical protein